VDKIIAVKTEDAKETKRRLAKEEGIFAGTSAGTNIVAALHAAEQPGSKATIATIAVDPGLRYLSTDVFRS
jgi:cysteine synthase A